MALHPARMKVVCCGRQWGKTVLGACLCVRGAVKGGHIWWVAPSFPVGELGWHIIDQLCRQIPGTHFEKRPIYRITLPTGGTIQLRSADNPDSLRGASLDGLVMDEAASAKSEAWPVLRPTLAVRQGWALFISTPKGENWFYDLYQEAARLTDWERWQFPSWSNPYFPPSEADKSREELSSLQFAQEYEADFISAGHGMFKRDWVRTWHLSEDGQRYRLGDAVENEVKIAECRTFSTVDLAWSTEERADYTVIATWAVTRKKHLLLLHCVRGRFEGPDILTQLHTVFETQAPGYFAIERATRQLGIIQEANRQGLPIREVRADRQKETRALVAQARMEKGNVWFPPERWVDPLVDELVAFPLGKHDDFVDALAYACIEIGRAGGALVTF